MYSMTPKSYFITFSLLLLLAHTNFSYGKNLENDPATSIISALDKLEKFSNSTNSEKPDQLNNFIKNNILTHFALKEMSQWISGPYSQHMSISDKIEFEKKVKNSFLTIISKNIGSFKTIKSRFKIQKIQYKPNKDAVVATQIKLYNNKSIKLDLHMRNIESIWKIIDVRTNGMSALIYYRHHFMSQLRMYTQNNSQQ
jgi:ABC-type transporter MlaC component